MRDIRKLGLMALIIILIGSIIPNSIHAITLTSNSLVSVNKSISINNLVTNDIAEVTLTVKGTPQDTTVTKPNDVILIVDKSGSMLSDNRLTAAKNATKEFIDLMDLTKHRVGVVDFDSYVSSYPLSTDNVAAKSYVDAINLGGSTDTGAAIRKATAMLANHRPEAQPTIVILTDGAANNSTDALASAKAAKDAGIIFYSIALLGANEDPSTSAPNNLLKAMSTSAEHHHFVLGSIGLSDVYKQIVEEIGHASAYNVKITDTVSPEFDIVPGSYDNNIPKPTINGNNLEWEITELKAKELKFTYQIRAKDSTKAGKYSLGKTLTTFEDHNQATYSLNSVNPTIEVRNPEPIISSIVKDKGITAGGEMVTINGQNFLPNAKVYFGSYEAAVSSVNTNEIVVTTPIGSQGTAVVKVLNSDGQFALGQFNYYAAPTLAYVTPSEGKMEGGNKIAVIGSNYMEGAKVFINGIEAKTEFSTKSKLYTIVPASQTNGAVTVKVVNPDGTEVEKADAYTYLAPTSPPVIKLDSLSIVNGKLEGGEQVYLLGENFDSKVKVYFGDEEAIITYFPSSSKLRVTTPAALNAGPVTVKVVNPDNTSSELINGFEYLAPPPKPSVQLDSLSVTSGLLSGGESVYLFGANFDRNVKIYFGTEEAVVNYYATSSKIRVTVPESLTVGTVTVKAENPDGSFSELANAYEYLTPPPPPPPEISYLSDPTALTGEEKTVYLFGKNISPSAKVYIGDEEVVMDFVTTSKVRIKISVSNQPLIADVKLVNPDGQSAVLAGGFTYTKSVMDPAPIISSISSNSGTISGNDLVTITGQNFKSGLKVYFGDRASTIVSITDTEIQVKTPVSSITGLVSVKVVNPDLQEFILDNGYNYEPLTITLTKLSVTSGPIRGGTLVYIYGTNFNNKMTVTVGGQPVLYTYLATTRIRIKMPAVPSPGPVDITVDRAGVQASIEYIYN
ncbi:IPT/TIG domain-containing protein [Peribacillus asahii]|uniref:IPT/TIG domain-containing protein n=1 Tax=Peribacillus asahii TaxID=228899 RepID=UPI0038147209